MPHQPNSIHRIDLYAGGRLRLAREQSGISQARLGNLLPCPITFQQVQKYEYGSNRMAISRLWDFANGLHLPIDFFLPGEPNGMTPLSLQERTLVASYRRLPAGQQQALIAFLGQG